MAQARTEGGFRPETCGAGCWLKAERSHGPSVSQAVGRVSESFALLWPCGPQGLATKRRRRRRQHRSLASQPTEQSSGAGVGTQLSSRHPAQVQLAARPRFGGLGPRCKERPMGKLLQQKRARAHAFLAPAGRPGRRFRSPRSRASRAPSKTPGGPWPGRALAG